MRYLSLILAFCAFGLAGCQSDSDVLASQFDQSCSVASDCVGVEELSVRSGMCMNGCPHTAINVSAKAAFDAAKQKAGAHCTGSGTPSCINPGPLACISGRCSYPAFETDASSGDVSSDAK